ncbi:UNKNOWN [Stylonychia lemnae]|uniref:Uncharacterized protein n=1 Tax=Stylonychia lemnae TaxID=5949 RepID=A0A078B6W2_STYLE|nr:UNKNOWN [Stylonychia lemnae]|eukprot:CDW90275.1 UNKNOWN [Stylonychia lemnae]
MNPTATPIQTFGPLHALTIVPRPGKKKFNTRHEIANPSGTVLIASKVKQAFTKNV